MDFGWQCLCSSVLSSFLSYSYKKTWESVQVLTRVPDKFKKDLWPLRCIETSALAPQVSFELVPLILWRCPFCFCVNLSDWISEVQQIFFAGCLPFEQLVIYPVGKRGLRSPKKVKNGIRLSSRSAAETLLESIRRFLYINKMDFSLCQEKVSAILSDKKKMFGRESSLNTFCVVKP